MKVTLLHYTPLWVADKAIGKCWDKPTPDIETTKTVYFSDTCREGNYFKTNQNCKIPGCNIERIDRVANKNKHASTIEHILYNFDIDGISRACLQELARHRMASLSVKSSRYTLKELKNAPDMWYDAPKDCDWATGNKFLVLTGNTVVDGHNILTLGILQRQLKEANDITKYMLPEAYKTSLVWSINARSLQNFLQLRTSKAALWEIRDLAYAIYEALPEDHKFLFQTVQQQSKEIKRVTNASIKK